MYDKNGILLKWNFFNFPNSECALLNNNNYSRESLLTALPFKRRVIADHKELKRNFSGGKSSCIFLALCVWYYFLFCTSDFKATLLALGSLVH